MTGTAYPGDAVAGVPTYTATQGRSAFAAAMGGATTARPLGGFTGIRPGTPSSILTIPTNTTWQLTPFGGYIDLESPGTTGGYFFSFQANETGSITAAAGSARVDLLYVRISDSNTGDGSALSPRVTTGVQDGIPGSGVPTLTVTRAFVVAQINVPLSGGGSPTFTWVAPYTAAAGGIVPAISSTYYPVAASYTGQYLDDLAQGVLLRSNGSSWLPIGPTLKNYTLPYTANAIASGTSIGTIVIPVKTYAQRVIIDMSGQVGFGGGALSAGINVSASAGGTLDSAVSYVDPSSAAASWATFARKRYCDIPAGSGSVTLTFTTNSSLASYYRVLIEARVMVVGEY